MDEDKKKREDLIFGFEDDELDIEEGIEDEDTEDILGDEEDIFEDL